MDIRELDKNFRTVSVSGVSYDMYSPQDLGLEGFPWDGENETFLYRLPDRMKDEVTQAVCQLAYNTAGGVIHFCTDSTAVLLKGSYRPVSLMPHMPFTGQGGFDVMLCAEDGEHLVANLYGEVTDIINKKFDFALSRRLPEGMHEYKIYLPLYAGLESLKIGLSEGAKVEKAPAYKVKPVLFYGSSITQGGCASRPSNCHAAQLAARVGAEQINLGFSGNAKGEANIAELIASLDLSCFVMDYDHNAPTLEHLMKTHEPFFKIIRERRPELPVVMVSRPSSGWLPAEADAMRRDVVMQTYINARHNGDKNVYFVDGTRFFDETSREMVSVDKSHPTDLGFYMMTKAILPVLRQALGQVTYLPGME